MKKILFILSLALIIPFTGISQRYVGVQSLYVNSDTELGETRGDDWFGWSLGTITTWISIVNWQIAEQGVFNRFEPEDLTDRIGEVISKVSYRWTYYNQTGFQNFPTLWDNPRIRVYTGGYFNSSDDYDRGNLVADVVAPMPPNNNQWQDIFIPPVVITGDEEIWFGVVHYWESGHIFMDVTGVEGGPLTEEEIASCYSPLKSDIVYFGADEEYEDVFFSYGQEQGEISSYYVRAFSTTVKPASNLNVVYDEATCNAELTWDAPNENPNAQYNIYRDGSRIKLNHPTTSYTDLATGFNTLEKHTWLVAVNMSGTESPGIQKDMPECAVCPAPTNVKAEYSEDCSFAEITWNAVENATQYIVYRNGEEKAKVTENKYTDTDPDGFNTTNSWEVVTVCAIGESGKTKSNPLAPCVGIRDNEITFSIHPNPATTEITIKAGNIFNTVEIVNFLGQKVISQNNSTDNVQIDVSNLNSGVYFVRIASENGVSVQKFVKK